MVDATLPDLSGTATLTAKETAAVTKNLSEAGKLFKQIASSTLKEIEQNKELNTVINVYNNRKVETKKELQIPRNMRLVWLCLLTTDMLKK